MFSAEGGVQSGGDGDGRKVNYNAVFLLNKALSRLTLTLLSVLILYIILILLFL